MTPALDPFGLLSALVVDSGALWGETATGWQRVDAAALLDHRPDAPRLHFLTRPRGGSKTTDLAAVALAALMTQAPTRSTSHAFARDRDQAALLLDALGGFVARTGLGGLVDVGSWTVTVRESGARLAVESADVASAYGHLPFLDIADELAQWPATRGAHALWEALVSGLPKRPDSRLAVLTTAGDPTHWSAKVLEAARSSDRWRVSEVRGPLPWADPDDLAEQARLLPASTYARLHLNRWTAAEDRLVNADDLAACVTLDGPLDHDPDAVSTRSSWPKWRPSPMRPRPPTTRRSGSTRGRRSRCPSGSALVASRWRSGVSRRRRSGGWLPPFTCCCESTGSRYLTTRSC